VGVPHQASAEQTEPVLKELAAVTTELHRLEQRQRELAADARSQGCSWSEVAAAAGVCRHGRRRSGDPRFGWASLSQTELVVADLAARGRTNRQIAGALLISPHTVDSYIRHIYVKLGISSRIALTRLVLAHGDRVPQ
jgi:DNA-binding CsgD family transcriptional regulator